MKTRTLAADTTLMQETSAVSHWKNQTGSSENHRYIYWRYLSEEKLIFTTEMPTLDKHHPHIQGLPFASSHLNMNKETWITRDETKTSTYNTE